MSSVPAAAPRPRPAPPPAPDLRQPDRTDAEAEQRHWLGEAEGLKVSLTGARAKLAQMDQITARRAHIGLGIPTFPEVAARTVTTPTTLLPSKEPR